MGSSCTFLSGQAGEFVQQLLTFETWAIKFTQLGAGSHPVWGRTGQGLVNTSPIIRLWLLQRGGGEGGGNTMVRSDLFGRAKVLSSLRGPWLQVGPRSRPGSFRAWIVPASPHLGHPGGKGATRPGCPF